MLCLIIVFLSGCSLEYGDGLLSLPKLPGEYLLLQHEIDEILNTGAVYATAETGSNRQAVQLIDVDGDGEDEAIAFFRMPGGDFLVCVYERRESGYEEIGRAEGFGNTIHAVHYPRISADGKLALALSWGLDDAGSYGMTVFAFENGELKSQMDVQYTSMLMEDIDGDSVDELFFAVRDASSGVYTLKGYGYSYDSYRQRTEAPLCMEVRSVSRMKLGMTADMEQAVFVDSAATGGGYVTDIVALTENGAVNRTIDLVSGSGALTWRLVSVSSTDINYDGIIDVPVAADAQQSSETQQNKLNWCDFKQDGSCDVVEVTYHNPVEEWYLTWPESWGNAVSVVRSSGSGVSRTSFVLTPENAPESDSGQPLLTLCVYTGDNRVGYAVADGVKIVRQAESGIYGYILPENAPAEYALTAEQVEESFKMVEKEWAAGGYTQ